MSNGGSRAGTRRLGARPRLRVPTPPEFDPGVAEPEHVASVSGAHLVEWLRNRPALSGESPSLSIERRPQAGQGGGPVVGARS